MNLKPRLPLTLSAVTLAGHIAAAAIVWPAALASDLRWAVWCVLGASAAATLVRLRKARPKRLTLREDGGVDFELADGRRGEEIRIAADSTVLPWLCVLRLRADGRALTIPITKDMVDAEEFRQLRVWLRWLSQSSEGAQRYS